MSTPPVAYSLASSYDNRMNALPIVLASVGVLTLAATDRLQPNGRRKPPLNTYIGYAAGIVWLLGIVLGFVNYKLLHAILLPVGSFILGGIAGIKPNQQ